MPAEALPSVISEQFLTCKICLEPYTKPKSLSCLHTFCLTCLQQHVIQNHIASDLSCPICRHITCIPAGGLANLRDNFFIASLQDAVEEDNKATPRGKLCDSCKCRGESRPAERRCLNCCEYLCGECVEAHQRLNLTKTHMTISYTPGRQVPISRASPEGDSPKETSPRNVVCCAQHPAEEAKLYCRDCAVLICKKCKISSHEDHLNCSIDTAIGVEKDALKRLSRHLKTQLSEYGKIKGEWEQYARDLEAQEKVLVHKIKARREEVQNAIGEWDQMMKKKVRDNFWQEKNFVSSKMSGVQKHLDTYRAVVQHLNNVLAMMKPTQLLGLTTQLKDELNLNSLSDDDLSSLSLTMKMFSMDMLSEGSQSVLSACVDLLGGVQFSYKKIVQNQRRFIKKLTFVNQFHTRQTSVSKARYDACFISFNRSENLVLTDRQQDKVSIFERNGDLVDELDVSIIGKPLSAVQVPGNDIIVSREKPTLCIFNLRNQDRRVIKDNLTKPCSLSLAPDGNIMILDYDQKMVTKLCSQTFRKLAQIRTPYNRGSKWDKLVIKPNGHLFVCVHKESCVYEFSPRGRRIGSYGRHGNREPGELSWPRGMCMDHHGNLIIADTGNACLQLVTVRGLWINLKVASEHALQCPTDVTVSSGGLICVLESTGLVKIFQYIPFR